jgi:FdhD protein
VELAKKADLTLVGRARGKRFVALAGEHRLVFDADPNRLFEEPKSAQRKGALAEAAE